MPEPMPPTIESLRLRAQAIERAAHAPKPTTMWIVVSWYAPDGRWKLWPSEWSTKRDADYAAARLPRGHTHVAVVELALGVAHVDQTATGK